MKFITGNPFVGFKKIFHRTQPLDINVNHKVHFSQRFLGGQEIFYVPR